MKVSIIGAGIISEEHLKACKQLEQVKTVSVADIDEKKACDIASRYNLRC